MSYSPVIYCSCSRLVEINGCHRWPSQVAGFVYVLLQLFGRKHAAPGVALPGLQRLPVALRASEEPKTTTHLGEVVPMDGIFNE